mmetsp:Transcript_159362/g.507299  ORF Transcript_159362/g.507299 Transcript_159362/m.507299 type:complete len:116 (+) Transcript_159362:97-444(+)
MFVRPPLAARRPAPLVVALVLVLCHHLPCGAAVLAVASSGVGLRGLSASGQPDEFYFRLRRFGNGSASLNAGEGKGGVGGGSPSWFPTDLQDADTFGKDYVVDSNAGEHRDPFNQ